MQIEINDILIFLFSFFGGSGLVIASIKLFMRKEAKEALKEDLFNVNSAIKKMTEDYVTCKYCTMQHDNLNILLQNMNHKLDILIEKG